MTDRQIFEMSETQYNELVNYINAAAQIPAMLIGGYVAGGERQARANVAWNRLGDEMGFIVESARAPPPNPRRFSAIPKEKKPREVTTESYNPATTPSMEPPPIAIGDYDAPAPTPSPAPASEPASCLRSGGGGDYAGGGASGSWDSASSSSGGSDGGSSGGSSDSGSSSSSSGD